MNSTKGVIRIIKLASNPNEYDEYYYLTDVSTDINSHLMTRITGNIWDAMKFIYNSLNEDEVKRINISTTNMATRHIFVIIHYPSPL